MTLLPHKLLVPAAAVLLLAIAGCKATKVYPDPYPGWHTGDYSTVLGRLQRVPAKNPDDHPVWVIRFGLDTDPYHGELALTPPERLDAYSGGELVEVRGAIHPELKYPDYPGTWYVIHSIRMWNPHR